MTFEDILAVLASIGGLGAFAGGVGGLVGKLVSDKIVQSHQAGLNRQLESHKADLARQIESHKDDLIKQADRNRLLLKRQELMFAREFEASAAFLKLNNSVVPEAWAPDLDWSDAQVRIAEKLCTYERDLKKLLDQHSVALSTEARKMIASAKSVANSGSFEVAQETDEGDYAPGKHPSDRVCKLVDEFYELMKEAEAQIRQDLKVGTFDA